MAMTSSRMNPSSGPLKPPSGGTRGRATLPQGLRPFRVFGRDGSGGVAAFWARVSEGTIETQPIVFLGSEGELCVIARNLDDYLWLLANGVGPLEMVDGLHRVPEQIPALVALAQPHTGRSARPLEAVIGAAGAELPALTALVESVTR